MAASYRIVSSHTTQRLSQPTMARMPASIRRVADAAINLLAAIAAVIVYFALIALAIVVAADPRWLPPVLLAVAVLLVARHLVRRPRR